MVEAEPAPGAADEAQAALEGREALEDGKALLPDHASDEVGIELVAEHRAEVEQDAVLVGGAAQARLDEVAHGGGDLDLAEGASRDEAPVGELL